MIAFFLFAQLCLVLFAFPFTRATIFVTAPLNTTVCQGGQSCTVQWVDNGAAPLLSTIGPCFVGLFNGQGILVQQIEPLNVASVHSFQFTPDPAAGPNSEFYYINFTSVDLIGSPPQRYTQFSPFFALEGMTGSFASPIASDTSTLSVPSTVTNPPSVTVFSTTVISPPASLTANSLVSTESSSAPTITSSSESAATSSPASTSFITSRLSSQTSTTPASTTSSSAIPSHGAQSGAVSQSVPTILYQLLFCLLALSLSL